MENNHELMGEDKHRSPVYFVPDIEDIRVGYEFEWKKAPTEDFSWEKDIMNGSKLIAFLTWGISPDRIRVPYLTKEQIEAEGWKLDFSRHVSSGIIYCKEDYTAWVWMGDLKLVWIRDKQDQTLFKGECKDINTFRYICKLLGI